MNARPTFNYIFHWYAVLSALIVMSSQHAIGLNQGKLKASLISVRGEKINIRMQHWLRYKWH